jgi:excisionase family DNA binding protein
MIPAPQSVPAVVLTLTYKQAADCLQVSERTIWSLVRRGELAAVRIGRAVRIPATELQAYLDRQLAQATALRIRDGAPCQSERPNVNGPVRGRPVGKDSHS